MTYSNLLNTPKHFRYLKQEVCIVYLTTMVKHHIWFPKTSYILILYLLRFKKVLHIMTQLCHPILFWQLPSLQIFGIAFTFLVFRDQNILTIKEWILNWDSNEFQIGKGVHQGCILSPCLFNLYESTSWEMLGWKKHKLESRLPGEISITSDDITLMAESIEELKNLLMKVKKEWNSWLKAQHSEN